MSAAQGADRSGVADGALAHFGRPIADGLATTRWAAGHGRLTNASLAA